MEFLGGTMREREASREIWRAWRQANRESPKRVFAERFVPLMEAQITAPAKSTKFHLSSVAGEIKEQVEKNELDGRALQPSELRDALLTLIKCWQYSVSLRNWAISQGYITASDR